MLYLRQKSIIWIFRTEQTPNFQGANFSLWTEILKNPVAFGIRSNIHEIICFGKSLNHKFQIWKINKLPGGNSSAVQCLVIFLNSSHCLPPLINLRVLYRIISKGSQSVQSGSSYLQDLLTSPPLSISSPLRRHSQMIFYSILPIKILSTYFGWKFTKLKKG